MKILISLILVMSSINVFADDFDAKIIFPKKSGASLFRKMKFKGYPLNGEKGEEYYEGQLRCDENYSDPGNHASNYAACSVDPAGSEDAKTIITLSYKTSQTIMPLMIEANFPGETEGPVVYYGTVRCAKHVCTIAPRQF